MKKEMSTIKKHLDSRYGICDTQELLMAMLIDEDIANASMTYANKFRKVVAIKIQDDILAEKDTFYKMMEENGQRKKFADYVWHECFELQFGYAFSLPHVVAYSGILMIEMNMCYHYGAEYWKTACLTVNAGLEGELEKGADYGTVSKAVNSVKDIVELPDINSSEMEFIPKDGKIMYGLKPIIGLGTAAIETVIKNRPYNSVQDFYEKNVESEEMPVSKAIVLVKAGAFHNISDYSRKNAAIELVNCHIKPKNKLTTVQLPKIIDKVYAAKKEFKDELTLFKFRQSIKGKTKVPMNEKIE